MSPAMLDFFQIMLKIMLVLEIMLFFSYGVLFKKKKKKNQSKLDIYC